MKAELLHPAKRNILKTTLTVIPTTHEIYTDASTLNNYNLIGVVIWDSTNIIHMKRFKIPTDSDINALELLGVMQGLKEFMEITHITNTILTTSSDSKNAILQLSNTITKNKTIMQTQNTIMTLPERYLKFRMDI